MNRQTYDVYWSVKEMTNSAFLQDSMYTITSRLARLGVTISYNIESVDKHGTAQHSEGVTYTRGGDRITVAEVIAIASRLPGRTNLKACVQSLETLVSSLSDRV
jgi:hypothetical protein